MSNCHTCDAANVCNSAHESINQMYQRTTDMGLSTIFDRHQDQQPQCGFGMTGVCCQLCSHGPCRITPKAPRGICGATADTIVARNLVRLASHGAAAYSHHLEEIIKTIKATAEGKTPYTIADENKLREIAGVVGLDNTKEKNQLAIELADVLLHEMRKGSDEMLALVSLFAPKTRIETWEKLGIVPGGILSEVRDAMTKSMTSINTDPVDLVLTSLRLSLSTGYLGLVATITLQDILLGTPQITKSEADLGIIDTSTVNIVAHGHVPLVATAVLQAAQTEEMQQLAKAAGATGINVYGSMCTGQELMQRQEITSGGFNGQLGNWLMQEYYVATGAMDLVMMDMNCSTPGLKTAADRFHTKLVSVDRVVRMEGVIDHVDYVPEKVAEQAKDLIKMAVETYKKRGTDVVVPTQKSAAISGFSVESILGALGGTLDPLLDAVKAGAIKGIVAVVGCTNTRNGHDTQGLAIMKELIKNNVLVLNAGCMSSAAQVDGLMTPEAAELAGEGLQGVCKTLGIPPVLNFGSCVDIGRVGVAVTAIANALGVDPSQLPVAVSAPEYLEQKAVADGFFAVAFGLLTHIGPIPPVTGSEMVTKLLTQDAEQLLGGRVLVQEDPTQAAQEIIAHIETKRGNLGI
ncbi:anaerobic carbon-monoxide dehydrogenase catalytic subunit [Dethiobacter alkaliphilus]|uniref:anaerobic carbon-monoxide dehydrogenase catalytic subunit n=1 Tax=Dethiobacter alkaliphilus TaxID=427926 RepID=UPI0022274377|nr:anaerobic carbon-monoxide dehydrogenase catalytic subunit [Dethiobacter alkaliphilus]MCW3489252.1 anaerobic carbon-monoxide dehydrogenase catalytic subunit [Dethiobacter alkaliphilus]